MSDDFVPTAVARALVGEHLLMGYRVFAELQGKIGLAGLLYLVHEGRRLEPREEAFLDELATCISAGDPRVWPMKAARLAASEGNALFGMALAPLLYIGSSIGPSVVHHAAQKLVGTEVLGRTSDRETAIERSWLSEGGRAPGFGVPFRAEDARLCALGRAIEGAGRGQESYWALSLHVRQQVSAETGIRPNIALGTAAALLDLGVRSVSMPTFVAALLQHLAIANAFEESQSPSQLLRRLPESSVQYRGRAPRCSPRALAALGEV